MLSLNQNLNFKENEYMKQMTAIELQDFLASVISPVKIDVREQVELKNIWRHERMGKRCW